MSLLGGAEPLAPYEKLTYIVQNDCTNYGEVLTEITPYIKDGYLTLVSNNSFSYINGEYILSTHIIPQRKWRDDTLYKTTSSNFCRIWGGAPNFGTAKSLTCVLKSGSELEISRIKLNDLNEGFDD